MRGYKVMAFIIGFLGTAGFSQTTVTLDFKVAGTSRQCVVHVPAGISKPAVAFFLHGAGGSGANFRNDTKADAVADKEKFIAAYPSGAGGNWDYAEGSKDFTFMLALIDTLDTRYQIDRNRVYVSGFSMGGGLTFAIACKYPDVFAAAAPVSAAGSACSPKRPIPMFITFGTKDMNPSATYMAAVSRWTAIDSCPATPAITRPYPSTNPQSVVTRITYGPCARGTYVVADSIQNGSHGWPNNTNTSVNQAEEVWAFCKQFSLAGSTAIRPSAVESPARPVSARFRSGSIHFDGFEDIARICVLDTRGRVVAQSVNDRNTIAVRGSAAGIYCVTVTAKTRAATFRVVIP